MRLLCLLLLFSSGCLFKNSDNPSCAHKCGDQCCGDTAPCCTVAADGTGSCAPYDCNKSCCGGDPAACCGGTCCPTDSNYCLRDTDASAPAECVPYCTSHKQCGSNRCCAPVPGGKKACLPATDSGCPCVGAAECNSGCCAPRLNQNGDAIGPYVCSGSGAATYSCCLNGGTCGSGYCCLSDSHDNRLCAKACTDDIPCGASHCVAYPNTIPFQTSCNLGVAQKGCGP